GSEPAGLMMMTMMPDRAVVQSRRDEPDDERDDEAHTYDDAKIGPGIVTFEIAEHIDGDHGDDHKQKRADKDRVSAFLRRRRFMIGDGFNSFAKGIRGGIMCHAPRTASDRSRFHTIA